MKHLQNNFTTPEQSKQLMKLGVPFDSSDCHYEYFGDEEGEPIYGDFPQYGTSYVELDMPCWSVGRLIEIFELCTETGYVKEDYERTNIGDVISQIVDATREDALFPIDFSKLED